MTISADARLGGRSKAARNRNNVASGGEGDVHGCPDESEIVTAHAVLGLDVADDGLDGRNACTSRV